MPLFSPEPPLADASDYAACQAAIREGSRSFYAASWLLPSEVRRSAFGLYAFCRLCDDAVDCGGAPPAGAIAGWRERLKLASEGRPRPPAVDRVMADLMRRYAIPFAVPAALLEGLAWDAEGRVYDTLEDLIDYAVRVAGTVGVMMALVMRERTSAALARACDLGVAMQLTNIARDVGEDARNGRLYLPRQWLREAGIEPGLWLVDPAPNPAIRMTIARLLAVAEVIYERARSGVGLLPAGCRPGILAAASIYAEIGAEIERNGHDSVSRRATTSARRKLFLIARALARWPFVGATSPAPALAEARFLVEAAAQDHASSQPSLRPVRDWRENFVGALATFERLQRAERFGD